jgi:hypothetical protein
MQQRILALLGLAPNANGDDISAAYWSRARILRTAGETEPGAAAELDELNAAYQAYTHEMARRGPPRPRLPRRRYWRAAFIALSVLIAALAVGIYRDAVFDAGGATTARAQDAGSQAIDWVRTQFGTPTPGARFMVIAHTDGQGAYLHVAPGNASGTVVALPDGAGIAELGDHATADGEQWEHVRSASGAEGWISDRWLATP